MGVITSQCKQDEDCPEKQYCYMPSKHCVHYTICDRYNRLETNKSARTSSQCGPCIQGYDAEVLADGQDMLCTKKLQTEDSVSTMDQTTQTWIIVGSLCSLIILIIAGYNLFKIVLKKCYPSKREVKSIELNDVAVETVDASAPPTEGNPFIKADEEILPNDNNAVIVIDKLVGASVWRTPSWVTNANYGTNRLDEVDVPHRERNVSQSSTEHNTVANNSNPSPERLTAQMPESAMDQDNAINTALMLTCLSGTHNTDADNNTDNDTDPEPEPNGNENKHEGKKGKNKTMLINQKLKNIIMNVNLINVNEERKQVEGN